MSSGGRPMRIHTAGSTTIFMAKREEIVGQSRRREDIWIVPSNEQIETVQLAGQREFAARTLERQTKNRMGSPSKLTAPTSARRAQGYQRLSSTEVHPPRPRAAWVNVNACTTGRGG